MSLFIHELWYAIAFGVLFIALLHYLIPRIHLSNELNIDIKADVYGIMVAIGLILHDLPEGFAAGAMIYVSLHALLPMARRYAGIGWVVIGVVTSLLTYTILHVLII